MSEKQDIDSCDLPATIEENQPFRLKGLIHFRMKEFKDWANMSKKRLPEHLPIILSRLKITKTRVHHTTQEGYRTTRSYFTMSEEAEAMME
jgi:hypothetical protein